VTTDPTGPAELANPQAPPPARLRTLLPRLGSGESLAIGGMVFVAGLAVLFLVFDSTGDVLYQQNEFVIAALFFAALIVAGEAGYWLGRRASTQASEKTKEHTSQIQTAVFAVLGLLLAFSFSMAVGRFDSRKQALVEETNAIGTAYLRAQLLPEPQRTAEGDLMRQYVDARLASGRPNWYLDSAL
jgi:hypothetical protein